MVISYKSLLLEVEKCCKEVIQRNHDRDAAIAILCSKLRGVVPSTLGGVPAAVDDLDRIIQGVCAPITIINAEAGFESPVQSYMRGKKDGSLLRFYEEFKGQHVRQVWHFACLNGYPVIDACEL